MANGEEAVPVIRAARGDVPFYREHGFHHPRAVEGTFRRVKWWAMAALLAVWHLAPFLRWDRGPGAPDQAILIDMPGRRAYFFFIEIWPQEVYYLTGLLLLAGVALFLMSALAGRVWCGFLCWQTVYTDLFIEVERLILGDRPRRMEFDRAPLSAGKVGRVALVNATWLAIAAACGISFTLYFGDAFATLREIFTGQAGSGTYLFILVIGGFCFLLAGYARERVCVYMCPYARFQSAMFDEHSLIVSYEAWRGEPRGPARKGQSFEGRGHCVDCRACVQSCPTGTDIRFGNQLSCIGCALCIDACNTVMDRFGLPRGLISYDSSANMQAREKGGKTRFRLIRPRTLVYFALLAIVGSAMVVSLAFRSGTEVNVLHERAPLFVVLSNGGVRNGYVYKILNMVREDRDYRLSLEGLPGATLDVIGGESGVTATTLHADRDTVATYRVYVTAPPGEGMARRTALTFVLTTPDGRVVKTGDMFAGPDK
ncbi:MAG: cytochrome c oxidase accessory protein CcoG [Magnetospirillum sp.]|nr:cytochrome c oxidase accessory protein CcoG [Magnetospirillum sp.]